MLSSYPSLYLKFNHLGPEAPPILYITAISHCVQIYQTMDPTKDQFDLDLTEDPNCHIHFIAADLPEPLLKLGLIKYRYSARFNNHIKVL